MLLVDRRIRRLLALEGQAEHGLARRPHDPPQAEQRRRREDVVRARRVDAERQLVGAQPGRRDRGQVHDRVGAAQRLDRLAVVGQVGDELFAVERGRADEVDAEHVEAVRDEVRDDRTARLAGAAGDDDAHQPRRCAVSRLAHLRRSYGQHARALGSARARPNRAEATVMQDTPRGVATPMKFRFGAIALALLLVVVAAGCGSKKKAAVTGRHAAGDDDERLEQRRQLEQRRRRRRRRTTTSGGSSTARAAEFAAAKNCAQLEVARREVLGGSAGGDRQRRHAGPSPRRSSSSSSWPRQPVGHPPRLRDDRGLRSPPAAAALQKAGITPGKTPTPKQLAAARRTASKSFSSPRSQAASKNLEAWGATHCGGLRTTS